MAKKYTLMNKEAIDELCKAVRESHSVSEAIDDDNLATNSTFSSVKIDNLIKANKAENKEYTDKKIDESIAGNIDDTLTKSGYSADSAAVGEKLQANEIATELLLIHAKQQEWAQDDIKAEQFNIKETMTLESGTITLTNTEKFPFNNSQQTVVLIKPRQNAAYIVVPEIVASSGNAGEIEISDILENGFKIAFTGSASSITVNYKIIGGYAE